MNRFKKIIPILLFAFIISMSCSKENDIDTVVSIDVPTAAMLVFPENNTECNEGFIVSDTETDVLFKWEEATNTSSYLLTITNLKDGTSREIKTISNEFLIRVLRGTPYSWVVKSQSGTSNETADSAIWKFYNAGFPEESHPPFPAEALSPQIGASIDEGEISLQWEATDVDNDIVSYVVFLDTNSTPVTEVGITSATSLNVTVAPESIYYWKVITTDALGNESHSQIFQFRVN
jgi:hypothetical protein